MGRKEKVPFLVQLWYVLIVLYSKSFCGLGLRVGALKAACKRASGAAGTPTWLQHRGSESPSSCSCPYRGRHLPKPTLLRSSNRSGEKLLSKRFTHTHAHTHSAPRKEGLAILNSSIGTSSTGILIFQSVHNFYQVENWVSAEIMQRDVLETV